LIVFITLSHQKSTRHGLLLHMPRRVLVVSFPPSTAIGQNINTRVSRGNSLSTAAQLAQINPEVFLFNNLNPSGSNFDPFSLASSTLNASRPTALGSSAVAQPLQTPSQVISLAQQSPIVQAAQQQVTQAATPAPAANPFSTALIPPAAQPTVAAPAQATPAENKDGNLFSTIGKAFGGFIDTLSGGNGEGAATGANIGGLIDGLTGGNDQPTKAAAPAKAARAKEDDDDDDQGEDDDIDIDIDI
jgi:hypothetical protein